jgi:streptogramin lyase
VPGLDGQLIGGITVGGGDVWVTFADAGGGHTGIAKITPTGGLTIYSLDVNGPIAYGPDGNLWILNCCMGQVDRVTTSGALTAIGSFPGLGDSGVITAGPSDALWLVGAETLASITVDGQTASYPVALPPQLATGSAYPGIDALISTSASSSLWVSAQGTAAAVLQLSPLGQIQRSFSVPEGSILAAVTSSYLWTSGTRIGRIDLATGVYRSFAIPAPSKFNRYPDPSVGGMTVGPDGNIWFTYGEQLGRVTPAGQVTLITPSLGDLQNIVSNAGKLWVTATQAPSPGDLPPAGSSGVGSYTPPQYRCTVPQLRNKTLAAAGSAARRAGCQLDPVKRPRHPRCSTAKLAVKTQNPRPRIKELGLSAIAIVLDCRPSTKQHK